MLAKILLLLVCAVVTGPAGMCGPKGDRGLPGESTVTIRRGPTDVQCPYCFKYLSDEPKQRFEMKPAGKLGEFSLFLFTCEKCHKIQIGLRTQVFCFL